MTEGPPSGTTPSHEHGHEGRTGVGFSSQGANSAITHHDNMSSADLYGAKSAASSGNWAPAGTSGGGDGGQAYNWSGSSGGQAYGGHGYTDQSGSTTISDAWKSD